MINNVNAAGITRNPGRAGKLMLPIPSAITMYKMGVINNINLSPNGYLCNPEDARQYRTGNTNTARILFLRLAKLINPARKAAAAGYDKNSPPGFLNISKNTFDRHFKSDKDFGGNGKKARSKYFKIKLVLLLEYIYL